MTVSRRAAKDRDRLLVAVLRSLFDGASTSRAAAQLARLPSADQIALLDRARRLEVGPLIARRLLEMDGLAPEAIAAARRIYGDNLARNLYLRAETKDWVGRLAVAGIPCRPLKGVGASLLLFDDLGARQSADIDLLVRPQDVQAAHALAVSRGFAPACLEYHVTDPDSKAIHLEPREVVASYSIDLHWSIEMPRLVPIDHADFWTEPPSAASGMASGSADAAPPLDLVGALFAIHLWRHGATLKTLVDFAAFVHRFDDRIPAIRCRLKPAGAAAGLDLALALAERVLGVRSRFARRRPVRSLALPWLERCLGRPFAERGPYFGWLVLPLELDGALRPLRRLLGRVSRPVVRDDHLHLGLRLRRVGQVVKRVASRGEAHAASSERPPVAD